MQIFEIAFQSNIYQAVVANNPSIWKEQMIFDGRPKSEDWSVPSFQVYNPKLKKGAFIGIGPGTFGIWAEYLEEVRSDWERSGEILPITVNGSEAFCLNVLEVCSCLDHERSMIEYSKNSGKVLGIDRFQFVESLVPESPLFKIPETARAKILVPSFVEAEDFRSTVEDKGLAGLRFTLLYDSKQPEGEHGQP